MFLIWKTMEKWGKQWSPHVKTMASSRFSLKPSQWNDLSTSFRSCTSSSSCWSLSTAEEVKSWRLKPKSLGLWPDNMGRPWKTQKKHDQWWPVVKSHDLMFILILLMNSDDSIWNMLCDACCMLCDVYTWYAICYSLDAVLILVLRVLMWGSNQEPTASESLAAWPAPWVLKREMLELDHLCHWT